MKRYWDVESGGSLTSSKASWYERILSYSASDILVLRGTCVPVVKVKHRVRN